LALGCCEAKANWGGETREVEQTMAVGLKTKTGQKGKREKERGKRVLLIFEKQQTNEFKYKFEFKHTNQCTSMYVTLNPYD
jgi:hypothetical protein